MAGNPPGFVAVLFCCCKYLHSLLPLERLFGWMYDFRLTVILSQHWKILGPCLLGRTAAVEKSAVGLIVISLILTLPRRPPPPFPLWPVFSQRRLRRELALAFPGGAAPGFENLRMAGCISDLQRSWTRSGRLSPTARLSPPPSARRPRGGGLPCAPLHPVSPLPAPALRIGLLGNTFRFIFQFTNSLFGYQIFPLRQVKCLLLCFFFFFPQKFCFPFTSNLRRPFPASLALSSSLPPALFL